MFVNHPSVGRERALTPSEEAAVRLYRAEESGKYGGPEHSEWWEACKSESASTGMDAMTIRDATWTWALHFSAYCHESGFSDLGVAAIEAETNRYYALEDGPA
jgi:hypothetical protein